jgi:hypothetical protein
MVVRHNGMDLAKIKTRRRSDTADLSPQVPQDMRIKFKYTYTEATERSAVNQFRQVVYGS